MEAALAPGATLGSSNELPAPTAHEDESRHSHFVLAGSQSPKATSLSLPSPGFSSALSESISKESKSRPQDDAAGGEPTGHRLRSSRMFRNTGGETLVRSRHTRKPLQLLDLPVDVLKEIVKEVTHTNDLTSLALCHSALHRLTVPHIYSRFDIVWPDSSTHAEPRSGVDALTYGLATLVMAEEIFGEAPSQRNENINRFNTSGKGRATDNRIRRRRGNHYAQFTKKFSLGNGPTDWVHEYLITKEGGKMLGTLVALAVARMRALETFIWDMPTGILRDVWLALSSLGDRSDGKDCRLEKIWVRFHDNSSAEMTSLIPHPAPLNPGSLTQANDVNDGSASHSHPFGLDRVEHPSFSTLPPLKSLSVLDIDELPYLDEMAVLIGKSLEKLRELRVGIARQAVNKTWVTVWEGQLQQVDSENPTAGSDTIGEKRLGGVLGTLTGFVHDMRRPKINLSHRTKHNRLSVHSTGAAQGTHGLTPSREEGINETEESAIADSTGLRDAMRTGSGPEPSDPLSYPPSLPISMPTNLAGTNDEVERAAAIGLPATPPDLDTGMSPMSLASAETESQLDYLDDVSHRLSHVLRLDNLELERVPISVPVLQKSIDWTCLTSLTLLHCQNHEQLWKTLRREFAPTPRSPAYPNGRRRHSHNMRKAHRSSISVNEVEMDYKLRLRRVHSNSVTPGLISFLKDTLAPDSLEDLFLQDAGNYSQAVTIQAIHRGPLRRHRGSLRKLLIDSSERDLPEGLPPQPLKWRRWMLPRDILSFVCGGKMPALRELGMAINYGDWHFFLQHLPYMPRLRSLYIPYLADHVHGSNVDPRELALQFVDIVALRPEVELCYTGIANKCFEILENRNDVEARSDSQLGHLPGPLNAETLGSDDEDGHDVANDEDDGEDVDGEDGDVPEEDEEEESGSDENDDDDDDLTDSDSESGDGKLGRARLRLREILFYDDKVAIFKARHGKL